MNGTIADVYKGTRRAAVLTGNREGTTFRYVPGYEGPPVATTLPVTAGPLILTGGAVPPFFAGLLPEGRRLTALRGHVKASADDELRLLLAVGRDTVGDVRIVPAGSTLQPATPALELPGNVADIDVYALLERHGVIDQVGLPGVQDKLSGRVISAPSRWSGTEIILKLNPPEYRALVENEAFFLNLARRAGLEVPAHRLLHDALGNPVLLVSRFDRLGDGTRLAFEDASQVLGLWPAHKYGVTMEEAAGALIRLCAAERVAARDVFRQVTFAVLTGNNDQHAKNLGVLQSPSGEWRISPAYDLPSTVPYGDVRFALTIQGRHEQLSRRALLDFGEAIGLPGQLAGRELDRLLLAAAEPLADVRLSGIPLSGHQLRKLQNHLNHQRRLLTA